MFRQRVKTLPEWHHYRRPTNSVQVFIESSTALILFIVGPNHRKEKICDIQTGQPERRETTCYLDAISYDLVISHLEDGLGSCLGWASRQGLMAEHWDIWPLRSQVQDFACPFGPERFSV